MQIFLYMYVKQKNFAVSLKLEGLLMRRWLGSHSTFDKWDVQF